jgi:glutamate synthase domain-containing protein 1/glutamate synthase domain-containing protein 3
VWIYWRITEKQVIMDKEQLIRALIASRGSLESIAANPRLQAEAEGGCGVIGMAANVPVAGRHLLQALQQMRNRGNGKGGGAAAVGLDPDFFGVQPEILANDYLLSIAYLDSSVRTKLESTYIEPTFIVDGAFQVPMLADFRSIPGLEVQPPAIWCYFVRVRPDVQASFRQRHGIADEHSLSVEDEIVYQNTYRLNRACYAATGEKQAFVLSHGKNLLVLKMVGYGDDVFRYYGLENLRAHVWIGHHRYPTKGKVWHPGGAHPFIGMHEALVHNGDFANYASICSYLAQRNIHPLFLTDTEVAALGFDLLHRIYGYPLEYVIEAMAPTTERDFTLLPPQKRRLYHLLQTIHMHGSPDGPWFFLIAQSDVRTHTYRLIGITDTSMLRPQVFALQNGSASIGFAASEKQAIDAALESLAQEDHRFWSHADLYWNARGGSHTDGGAFIFNVQPGESGMPALVCTDKFGRAIAPDPSKRPFDMVLQQTSSDAEVPSKNGASAPTSPSPLRGEGRGEAPGLSIAGLFDQVCEHLPTWDYDDVRAFLDDLLRTTGDDDDRDRAVAVMNLLMDRHYPTGTLKRSCLLALFNQSFIKLIDCIRATPTRRYVWAGYGSPLPECVDTKVTLVLDARGYPPEGNESLSRAIVVFYQRGFRRIILVNTRGHRFIGNGLGPMSEGLQLDVYGSPGDYLASGIDGAEVIIHSSAQDQLAQIMKGGKLVVYGDVGQTFMYAAKGGEAFVLGNAAGRPLINAVGRPRVVINGTCLDYLAESFMAGDPQNGGGFIILNGIRFDEDGVIRALETPYPGGNLFSLASGGAIYIRDPRRQVTADQLNGGEFTSLTSEDWTLIRPYLEKNDSLFGISLKRLLTVDGILQSPAQVYRKIRPAGHKALMPEEAWVTREA